MRLLILSDVNTLTTGRLIRATLALVARRPGTEVCGIVTDRPADFRLPRHVAARRLARAALVAATNRGTSVAAEAPGTIDLDRVAARHGLPVVAVPEGGVNGPAFARILASRLRPDVTLCLYGLSRLGPDLLRGLGQAVNYHDGLLPAYRGVKATSFSMYAGEARSGFSFHRMTEGLDEGPVLVDGSVAVGPRASLRSVMHAKSQAAADALPLLLARIVAGEPGTPQSGPVGYFSRADAEAIMHVPRPHELTADDLRRRARAFGVVSVTIAGAPVRASRFRTGTPGRPLAFRTLDGVVLEPDRIDGLPARPRRPR